LLGFISYGLSINLYISAQAKLGAAKTSAFYSIAPFLGVIFSLLFVGERPGIQFYIALVVLLLGTIFILQDTLSSKEQ
jgi:drug/metabolite transporter (DMT)-like permease